MFCPKCGTKNNADDRFCASCGAEMIDNQLLPQTDVIQQPIFTPDVDVQQSTSSQSISIQGIGSKIKALPAIAKILPIVLISLAFVIGVLYSVGASMTKPEKIVRDYFNAIISENWDKAFNLVAIENIDSINKESFTKALKTSIGSEIISFEIIENPSPLTSSALISIYEVRYIAKGESSPQTQIVTLIKQNKKLFLLFDSYKISIDNIKDLISDFQSPNSDDYPINGVTESPNTVVPPTETTANNDSAHIEENGVYGNTIGNTINGGIVAIYDGWVYYSNYGLWKARTDGMGEIKLDDDYARYINVVGDWIYYTPDIGESFDGIWKIRTDGTQKTRINYDYAQFINVVDDWIYYTIREEGFFEGIYKIHTDGTQKTKLSSENAYYISIIDGWIYYTSETLDSNEEVIDEGIYKIRTDGTQKTKINDYVVSRMNVYDGSVYYTIRWYTGEGIYRIGTDGTGKVMLSDDNADTINVVDDWIYFRSWKDANDVNAIYKIRTDGTQRTRLTDYDNYFHVSVVGDWVYYRLGDGDADTYKMRTDGTQNQFIDPGFIPEQPLTPTTMRATELLNLREEPNYSAEVKIVVPIGETVRVVTGEVVYSDDDEWVLVTYDGMRGYVLIAYLAEFD